VTKHNGTKSFTARVYDELASAGYSRASGLEFLAERLGKTKSAVSAMLNAHKTISTWPGDSKVMEYAAALQVPPSQLMRGA